jgi:hypothetical protein
MTNKTVGFFAVTEITLETDYKLYYGPTEASSVVTSGGRFRVHILPGDIQSILVVSRDFAGTDVDREAVYSVEQALAIKFIMPIELKMDSTRGTLQAVRDAAIPRKAKKHIKRNKI